MLARIHTAGRRTLDQEGVTAILNIREENPKKPESIHCELDFKCEN